MIAILVRGDIVMHVTNSLLDCACDDRFVLFDEDDDDDDDDDDDNGEDDDGANNEHVNEDTNVMQSSSSSQSSWPSWTSATPLPLCQHLSRGSTARHYLRSLSLISASDPWRETH